MAINLKHIDGTNTLDNINYNFDQILANGGGIHGIAGSSGNDGLQGPQGPQGPQGVTGAAGPVGAIGLSANSRWKSVTGVEDGLSRETVTPIHDPLSTTNPPTVSLGFASSDSEYDAINTTSQLLINRKSWLESNFELSSDATSSRVKYKLDSVGGIPTFSIKLNNGYIEHIANRHFFKSGGITVVQIDSSGIIFNTDATFNGDTIINATNIKLNAGSPDTGKVAVSSDDEGNIIWKNANEVKGTVQIGTIVGLLSTVYSDSNNFIDSQTWVTVAGTTIPIEIGRGVGNYAGWYSCNGKTWKSGDGVGATTYSTPNLNSLDLSIEVDADGISNQAAVSTTSDPSLLGGADIGISAAYAAGSFTVTQTISNTTFNAYIGGVLAEVGHTEFDVVKVPQIIYLGETDLYFNA